MSHGYDFEPAGGLPTHKREWESPQDRPPGSRIEQGKLPRMFGEPSDRSVNLVEE